MKVGYVDSSCLVAVSFLEPGYEAVVDQLEALDLIVSSNLLEAELRAALKREGVDGEPSLLGRVSWLLPDPSELTFVTLDQHQAAVAEMVGLRVVVPG